MMPICEYNEPNYWLSCITLKEESIIKPIDIMVALEKENIDSRPVWKPMHMQPFFKDYEFVQVKDGISVSEDLFNRGVCLPSDTKMSVEDMKKVADIVKGLFKKNTEEVSLT